MKRWKLVLFGHAICHDNLSKAILQGTLDGEWRRGRWRICWKDIVKDWTWCSISIPVHVGKNGERFVLYLLMNPSWHHNDLRSGLRDESVKIRQGALSEWHGCLPGILLLSEQWLLISQTSAAGLTADALLYNVLVVQEELNITTTPKTMLLFTTVTAVDVLSHLMITIIRQSFYSVWFLTCWQGVLPTLNSWFNCLKLKYNKKKYSRYKQILSNMPCLHVYGRFCIKR